jgi:hypothetical protein
VFAGGWLILRQNHPKQCCYLKQINRHWMSTTDDFNKYGFLPCIAKCPNTYPRAAANFLLCIRRVAYYFWSFHRISRSESLLYFCILSWLLKVIYLASVYILLLHALCGYTRLAVVVNGELDRFTLLCSWNAWNALYQNGSSLSYSFWIVPYQLSSCPCSPQLQSQFLPLLGSSIFSMDTRLHNRLLHFQS